jgi:hypothetical protein
MLHNIAQTDKEFNTVRQRAFLEEWFNFFTGRPTDLLSFEEVRQHLRLQDSSYKGLQEIELDKIVGSVGRYRDFTRTFLPKNDLTKERWQRVDGATHDMAGTPPIEVFKIGGVYFVRDGNHRVSVAQAHKAKTIQAYVIEYHTQVPIDNTDELDDILLKAGYARFLEDTHIDTIRPGHNIIFTEPGRYRLIKKQITFHKYLKETECGCEIPYEKAVASWYDQVYTPLIQLIRERDILKDFPGRTEADLFAWLVLHREALAEELKNTGQISNEDLVKDLEKEKNTNPFQWLLGLFQRGRDITRLSLKVERAKFLKDTRLKHIRPNHRLKFTEPACYELVKEHIVVHKYLKETEMGCEISSEEAVASWYDTVYVPIVALIRKRKLLEYFPGRTESDLYLWFVSRRAVLEKENQALGDVPNEKIIKEIEQEGNLTPIPRLAHFLRQQLDL